MQISEGFPCFVQKSGTPVSATCLEKATAMASHKIPADATVLSCSAVADSL